MAPDVGQPCAAVGGEDVLRRYTGYASFGGPSGLVLSTPMDFGSATPSQVQPDKAGDFDRYFSYPDHSRTFKNVAFRGAGRTKDKRREMTSDASDESSEVESMDEPRRHIGGGSRSGAPRHTPPHLVGGSHGGATPPLGMPEKYGGTHRTRPPLSMGRVSGRRQKNANLCSQSGGFAGGAMPHCSSLSSDASPRRRRGSVDRSSRVLPTLKLGTYNGSTCLKTFLAKFENCLDYYDWDDRERLCYLRASSEGPAGQVLWDAGQQTSVEEVIILLKNRFGSLNEEERYRSELKARRRRRGEPLQAVYQDIRRLMALAFPGQSGPLWEIMARDAFVESLADPALRYVSWSVILELLNRRSSWQLVWRRWATARLKTTGTIWAPDARIVLSKHLSPKGIENNAGAGAEIGGGGVGGRDESSTGYVLGARKAGSDLRSV